MGDCFPCPNTLQSSVKQFLAIKISSQFNGLGGGKLFMSLLGLIFTFFLPMMNRETGSASVSGSWPHVLVWKHPQTTLVEPFCPYAPNQSLTGQRRKQHHWMPASVPRSLARQTKVWQNFCLSGKQGLKVIILRWWQYRWRVGIISLKWR